MNMNQEENVIELVVYDDIDSTVEKYDKLSRTYKTKYWFGINRETLNLSLAASLKKIDDRLYLLPENDVAEIGLYLGNWDDGTMAWTFDVKINFSGELCFVEKQQKLEDWTDQIDLDEIKKDWSNTQSSLLQAFDVLKKQAENLAYEKYGKHAVWK